MKITKHDVRIKVVRWLIALVFMFFSAGGQVFAQGDMSSGAFVAEKEVEVVEIRPNQPDQGNVTVNFKDVDILSVLNYLSEVSGVDIVPSPGVDAKITMRLRNKSWDTALDIVTRNYGYVYSREGDIIRVMPKSKLQTEEAVTEVIPLNYIIKETKTKGTKDDNIAKLMTAVNSILNKSSGEKATFLPSANAIVITAIPSRVNNIKEMITLVDKKTPQIMLEAKIIEVTLDRNDQFGVDWNVVVRAAGARRPITLPFTNTGLLSFLPGEQGNFLPTRTFGQDVADFPEAFQGASGIDTTAAPVTDSIFSYGTLDFSQFTAVLSMIDEWDDTKILSSPRITTLNNQKAVIKVIQNVYLQKEIKSSDTATTVTVEFEKEAREVGVILEVTPHVNEKGEISVNLHPEVSSDLTFVELPVSNSQNTVAMRYDTREADTQVMVRDNETIFIGGLIRETISKQDHKFPILGDLLGGIPLVGSIFKYEQDNVVRTEIVFFVTVHLLKDGQHSIQRSATVETYNQYYRKAPEAAPAGEAVEAKKVEAPTLQQGQIQIVAHEVSVATTGEKKAYKPFLDFRKK